MPTFLEKMHSSPLFGWVSLILDNKSGDHEIYPNSHHNIYVAMARRCTKNNLFRARRRGIQKYEL
jgi:hypothetical protein